MKWTGATEELTARSTWRCVATANARSSGNAPALRTLLAPVSRRQCVQTNGLARQKDSVTGTSKDALPGQSGDRFIASGAASPRIDRERQGGLGSAQRLHVGKKGGDTFSGRDGDASDQLRDFMSASLAHSTSCRALAAQQHGFSRTTTLAPASSFALAKDAPPQRRPKFSRVQRASWRCPRSAQIFCHHQPIYRWTAPPSPATLPPLHQTPPSDFPPGTSHKELSHDEQNE